MKTFKEFINEIEVIEINLNEYIVEHQQYKQIPKTQKTYRIDKANTSTPTQDHAHVYASKNNQLYAVNLDGSGHDGFHGYEMPKKDADYFRNIGFGIASNNILESLNLISLNENYKVYRLVN